MTYYFQSWFDMVKELQGSINIFSDAGPDVRWVGDEKGYAGTTCWSMINRTSIQIGTGNVGYVPFPLLANSVSHFTTQKWC